MWTGLLRSFQATGDGADGPVARKAGLQVRRPGGFRKEWYGLGTGTGYSGYTGNWSHDTNNNAITLETVNIGNGLLLGRYQYPKLIAKEIL